MNNKKKFETRAIHVGQKPEKLHGSVSLPIYQTSTFKQEEFGEYKYDYSRAGNPTRTALEQNICAYLLLSVHAYDEIVFCASPRGDNRGT